MTRIAVIEKDKCHPMECGNYLCIRLCPVNRTGKECIVKGTDKKAFIDAELCTGCGICPKRCPFGAIHIINLPESLDGPPIHRYGANGFHLYNLPIPHFGKVVGLIGRNGIGKSTAMKVLAGVLQPNLGRDQPATYQELIEFFKGKEAQLFFEKLAAGKIKVAYKPQAVEIIPKHNKGTVFELLRRVDEKKKLEEYAKQLHIDAILQHDIQHLSGGELQRVAICATALRKANVYLFDEPTSYLDIKQRLHVSVFIKSLTAPDPATGEQAAVLLIEHDLIILDYLTDLVQIMYGEVAAFGVVSQPKSTKNGINTYLEGYLKEENMQFRDHRIMFHEKTPIHKRSSAVLTSWSQLVKQLGSFSLSAPSGEIARHEVCGIVGENALGKTTFAKILSGVLEQDHGEIQQQVKIAYKPQYLDVENEELVAFFLRDVIAKYEVALIRPLDLKDLFTKKLCELSGGELQRVMIAQCLSQDADLYVLDEPSAYLDVEQRLMVSKAIRDLMTQKGTSCFVIDHDLLFVDYLSDRLSVFLGEPAVKGVFHGPLSMDDGMNLFLKDLGVTFRRDPESHRPRANDVGSQMDQKQKTEGKLYYT